MADELRKEEQIEEKIEQKLEEIARDTKEVEKFEKELTELRHRRTVEVSVDGHPYPVSYGEDTTVMQLIKEALKESGSVGRAPSEWQLKYDGRVLNENEKIAALHLPAAAVLMLSLRAGNLG